MLKYAAALPLLLLNAVAYGDDSVTITDSSQLSWQIQSSSGKVYFMNLNQFDSTFLSCCYNYYIDTSTAGGRTVWSAVLTNIAQGTRLTFYVSDKTTPGPVTFLGN